MPEDWVARPDGAPAAAGPEIAWDALATAALAAAEHAYAPYSGYAVGAAGLVDDGRIVSGCNIENASFGLTMCGENSMVAQLHMTGGGRLVAVYTVGNGQANTPCGRCRQVLWEFAAPGCLVSANGVPRPLSELLPVAFPDESDFRPDRHRTS